MSNRIIIEDIEEVKLIKEGFPVWKQKVTYLNKKDEPVVVYVNESEVIQYTKECIKESEGIDHYSEWVNASAEENWQDYLPEYIKEHKTELLTNLNLQEAA